MNALSLITVTPFGLKVSARRESYAQTLYSGPIRGIQYCQVPYMYHHLREGSALQVVREMDNLFDPHALAVYYKHFKIGFISAVDNREVAGILGNNDVSIQLGPVQRGRFQPPSKLQIVINKQNQ